MKSSQVMARLEAAGWKRIRAVGSHFTYEREGKRALYAYGRPQTEVGKRNLRDIEARFRLKEIEKEMQDKRQAEAAHRNVVSIHVRENPEEMTDEVVRLLYAQLHRDHKVSLWIIAEALQIDPNHLSEYMHHQKPLPTAEQKAVYAWFGEQEKKLGLVRDRETLRRAGYGPRVGTINRVDPWLKVAQAKLKEAIAQGATRVDLGEATGVHRTIIESIVRGAVKTVYPDNKAKIQDWIERWDESNQPESTPEPDDSVKAIHEFAGDFRAGTARTTPIESNGQAIDPELEAIQRVMAAIKGLTPTAAGRALRYALERV